MTPRSLPLHDSPVDIPSHFERFLKNISLDQPKLNRIKSEHTALRGFLECDQFVRPALHETFIQGSYAHGTAIRPLGKGTEFDVDVCCILDLTAVPSGTDEPRPLVRWLARRLKKVEAYRRRVSTRPRCVRIDFPGDFHMDVVPLVEGTNAWDSNLYIPNRTVDDWEATNPKGIGEWYYRQNDRTNGRFVRVAKMLKHWRNQVFDKRVRPPSIALEVLVANAWPLFLYTNSDAHAVSGVLNQLANRFRYSVPRVMNPSLQRVDLLRDWDRGHHEAFRARLNEAADLATAALQETDADRSISLWQRLFRTRFPQRAE